MVGDVLHAMADEPATRGAGRSRVTTLRLRGAGCGGSKPAAQDGAKDGADESSTAETGFKWVDDKITKFYSIDKEELGSGSFGVVKKCRKKSNGKEYAVKMIDKAKVDVLDDLQREVKVMSQLEHPNIVRLYEVYDEPKQMCLVLEMVEGGELFDRVAEATFFSEKDAARTIAQLCDALAYMHARDIVHRDLKPDNILLSSAALDAPIKITDFGFARTMAGSEIMKTACGTPEYVAPEVLRNEGYTSGAVDMWSTGVILYVLLCGFPPFDDPDLPVLFEKIMGGEVEFPSPWWDDISDGAKVKL